MLVNLSHYVEGWKPGGGEGGGSGKGGKGGRGKTEKTKKTEESASASKVMSGVVDWWPSVAT